jgi:hypothetical protein
MNNSVIEGIGWVAAAVILLAFALLSFNLLSSNSVIYQVMNILGPLGITIVSLRKKAYQAAFLNAAWMLIAMVALGFILF